MWSKVISLNFKNFVFHGVHFGTGERVTSQFEEIKSGTCLEILLEIHSHAAAEVEIWFLP